MLAIVARTAVCVQLLEFLNSFGRDLEFDYTKPEYFGEREISVFLVKGIPEDLEAIKGFVTSTFDTDSVVAAFYISSNGGK